METQPHPAAPFSKFASVYDAFMDYIDYPGWVRYICEIITLYDIKGKRLLDLACGTGTCAILFAREGFEVAGIDASPQMLARAREKVGASRFGVRFFCQDMREFQIEGKVNIVTCLYDSLNYLLQKDDLGKTFVSACRAMEEGGVFIFDMNTEYALKKVWGTGVLRRREGGFPSVWKNEYDSETGTGTLHLTWTAKENGEKVERYELHRERFYSNEEIGNLLKEAGFKRVAIYAHRTFHPPAEVTPRIMVVAVK